MNTPTEPDEEILAITTVYAALKGLEAAAQKRVVGYVLNKLNLSLKVSSHEPVQALDQPAPDPNTALNENNEDSPNATPGEEFEGISSMAKKWMRRSGLTANQLSTVFSLGIDEIDLITNKIPGKSTRARMRSVFLLKGVAAYLGGTPRFAYEQVKEACMHYDAYDQTNFSKHVKDLVSEVAGSKEQGYSLTPRGLANASELIKETIAISDSD